MFVMIGFYSKRDSESCYIRHHEDISYSQRPEAATRGGALSLWKKWFLEISQNSQEKVCVLVCIEKETLALVFSCQSCEISKNTFFTGHSWMTAPEHNLLQGFWLYFRLKIRYRRYGTCKNQSKTRPHKLVSSTN